MSTRREFLKRSGLAFAALAWAGYGAPVAAGKKPGTNVILIMADDFGYECCSGNGGLSYKTPRLDEMACRGMRFTNCHSQPVCTPTRVKIMTGRYNFRNYVAFETLDPKETTFGHIMKDVGYKTCIAGKWQLCGRGKEYVGTNPTAAGFDNYCMWDVDKKTKGSRYWNATISQDGKLLDGLQDAYGPDVFCQYILDYIEANKDEPFFLYYPMALTHGPHVPTPDSKEGDKNTKRNTKYIVDMVAYADKIVGKILDKVDEAGIAEKTLVIFTGDNGTDKKVTSLYGDRKIRGGKGRTIDAGTHVPTFAYWRGTTRAGSVCEDLIDFSDMVPTFAELGNTPMSAGLEFDGVSFLPQLRGEKGNPKDYIFVHYEKGKYAYEGQKMNPAKAKPAGKKNKLPYTRWVRDKRWKLYHGGKLFDVAADPDETREIKAGSDKKADAIRKKFQAVLDKMAAEAKS